jgi:hypothetical protein
LVGIGSGRGLGAGIGEAVRGATDRNYNEKYADQQRLAALYPRQQQQMQAETYQRQAEMQRVQMENIGRDNVYQDDRLAEMKNDRLRKEDDRQSRERTARMNQVGAMDPKDPRFADLTKALGDVNLPITPKDAGKQVDLKQDQRTGEWTTILTDKVSGKQEVRPVMKDGKVYRSTPTVVMQGEYGLLRQNDQQQYNTNENTVKYQRDVQKMQLAQQMRVQLEAIKAANQAAIKEVDAARRAEHQNRAIEAQKEYIRLRAEAKNLETP